MKNYLVLLMTALLLIPSVCGAAPVVKSLTNDKTAFKRRVSKEALRHYNTQEIKDPAAREAIEHIMNYLDLTHTQSALIDYEADEFASRQKTKDLRTNRKKIR